MARTQVQQQSLAPVILAAGVLGAAAGTWFGLPGVAALPLALIVAAWSEPQALLTGKKDAAGLPTAAGPGEAKMLRRYRMWSDLKWKLVVPSKDWLPGWPVLGSWIVAVVAAGVAFHLPVNTGGWRLVNALSAWLVIAVGTAVRRRHIAPGDVCPGVRVDSIVPTLKTHRGHIAGIIAAVTSPVAAFFTIRFLTGETRLVDPVTGDVVETMSRWEDVFRFAPGVDPITQTDVAALPGVISPVAAGVLVGMGVCLAVFAWPWTDEAMAWWKQLREARLQWESRWSVIKQFRDEAPVLLDLKQVGTGQQFIFEAPVTIGSAGMASFLDKLVPAIGSGTRTVFLDVPEEGPDGPTPGSIHPSRFCAVLWPTGQEPDLKDPDLDQEVAELWIRSGFAWVCAANKNVTVPLLETVRIESEDGSAVLWRTTWAWQEFGPRTVRANMLGALESELQSDVLVHHRDKFGGPAVYIGAVDCSGFEEGSDVGTDGKNLADMMWECHIEDVWTKAWYTALKTGTNEPLPQFGSAETRTLADGSPIERLAFAVREGQDPTSFFGLEAKMAAAVQKPFFALTGWPAPGDRAGSRHHQGFCTYTSDRPSVPSTPDRLAPSEGSVWVLAAHVNAMFRAAKFPQPELVLDESECLTAPRSPGHIWKATVRLYGGATLADVRGRADRLRTSAGVPWLRVEPEGERCIIYMGAEPANVTLALSTDGTNLESLDWSQAFVDSGVRGVSGGVPVLTDRGVLPNNEKVQVFTFDLPTGLDTTTVKAALPKLRTATGNSFIEVKPSDSAREVVLYVSADNPLPRSVGIDWGYVDESESIPFATGVEGQPIKFDPRDSPHALLAGVTGSGKSVMAQVLLYGAAIRGYHCFVIDPIKGGADFQFMEDRCHGFTGDIFEAAALMKAIYQEVVNRKNINSEHGVGGIDDLPGEVRPPRIAVFIDEFTSLLGKETLPPKSDDPEMALEREQIEALNHAKAEVGTIVGKLAREARSAGVSCLLGTQKMSAKMLDSIPGGASDLKTNLARTLLGNASSGDRMSALRAFDDAPVVKGDIPKGRGLWEPLTSAAVLMQVWFAPQSELRQQLVERVPEVPVDERVDFSAFLRGPDDNGTGPGPGSSTPDLSAVPVSDEIVDVGSFTFSLDDLGSDDEMDVVDLPTREATDGEHPPGADADGAPDEDLDWSGSFSHQGGVDEETVDTAAESSPVRFVAQGHAVSPDDVELVRSDDGQAENGWWAIDAVCDWLNEHPGIIEVVVAIDGWEEANPLGGTNGEMTADVLEMFGVTVRSGTVEDSAAVSWPDAVVDDPDDEFGPVRSAGPVTRGDTAQDF